MTVEDFEELAAGAPEHVSLEFLFGQVGAKVMPDGDHSEMIKWLQRQCMQHRPDLWLYPEAGLVVEAYRKGRARPDGVLAPDGAFAGQGEWAEAAGVLMTVEVTSFDADTDGRDRREKPRAYAEAGIPVYLLIDRSTAEAVIHSEPVKGEYSVELRLPLGKVVTLPEPVGFDLETGALLSLIR
ncbi:Uma2 family endonuclease [Streptacidiphilus sp. 4-A2]|nr:Uma2 family endonuclease [Streptacidiphilus sp. 4-A2]